eukprot:COSAG01_NODE_11153_length_1994_cov_9.048734_1_plen_90_part_00
MPPPWAGQGGGQKLDCRSRKQADAPQSGLNVAQASPHLATTCSVSRFSMPGLKTAGHAQPSQGVSIRVMIQHASSQTVGIFSQAREFRS